MSENLQKKLQTEIEKYKAVQKDYQKCVSTRSQLDAQLNENTLVKEELDTLESDARVFKLMGPVLVKQDVEEARQNVQKRMDYIGGEIKRHDNTIKDLEKKQESHRDNLAQLQRQFQMQQAQGKGPART